jgi:putative oxidoreductase
MGNSEGGKSGGSGKFGGIGVLILRMTIGIIFVAHGLQRVFGLFDGPGISGTARMLDGIGFAYPVFWAWAFAATEAIGGIFLTLGILPRTTSAVFAGMTLLGIMKIYGPKGFFYTQNGIEYPLVVLMVCLFFVMAGGGKFSFFDKL